MSSMESGNGDTFEHAVQQYERARTIALDNVKERNPGADPGKLLDDALSLVEEDLAEGRSGVDASRHLFDIGVSPEVVASLYAAWHYIRRNPRSGTH